ncbi:hypothetical protein CUMW_154900 [Citrus unshiu]|uniref:Uncharacterized protein n=1 Tax=Citrus unshiu TaxID=55188 RepID=A0A2H5PPE3_CITUN|nr:hypothetical protein CUMW_154900 [Citrus unshiu]
MAIELTDFDNNLLLEFQDTEKWGQVWSLVCTAASDDSAGTAVILLSLPTSPHVSLSILPSKIALRGMEKKAVRAFRDCEISQIGKQAESSAAISSRLRLPKRCCGKSACKIIFTSFPLSDSSFKLDTPSKFPIEGVRSSRKEFFHSCRLLPLNAFATVVKATGKPPHALATSIAVDFNSRFSTSSPAIILNNLHASSSFKLLIKKLSLDPIFKRTLRSLAVSSSLHPLWSSPKGIPTVSKSRIFFSSLNRSNILLALLDSTSSRNSRPNFSAISC